MTIARVFAIVCLTGIVVGDGGREGSVCEVPGTEPEPSPAR